MNMEIKPMGNTEQEKCPACGVISSRAAKFLMMLQSSTKNPVYRITTSITLAPCKAKQSFPAWKNFIPLLMSV